MPLPDRYPSYPQPSDIDGPLPGYPHGRRVPTEDEIAEAREEAARDRAERKRAFRFPRWTGDEWPYDDEEEDEDE